MGFEGSCPESVFDQQKVDQALSPFEGIHYHIKDQEKVNWNEEWEKNYDPIVIEGKCIIRASFHSPRPEYDYELIVTPKMSFGTGHHATTYQIVAYQMQLDHVGKRVLDVGTGTGILAIMAHKRGATSLVATDIDDWCIENSSENFGLNGCTCELHKTDIEGLEASGFDIIIANINKNVLLLQIGVYAEKLTAGGELILSGFYQDDIPDLIHEAGKYGLRKKHDSVKR